MSISKTKTSYEMPPEAKIPLLQVKAEDKGSCKNKRRNHSCDGDGDGDGDGDALDSSGDSVLNH